MPWSSRICPDSAVARLRYRETSGRRCRGSLRIRAILAGPARSDSRGRRLIGSLRGDSIPLTAQLTLAL
jgi:hypothetical protein